MGRPKITVIGEITGRHNGNLLMTCGSMTFELLMNETSDIVAGKEYAVEGEMLGVIMLVPITNLFARAIPVTSILVDVIRKGEML